eukprot:3976583-Pleurochrysis_carterae.AAC.2
MRGGGRCVRSRHTSSAALSEQFCTWHSWSMRIVAEPPSLISMRELWRTRFFAGATRGSMRPATVLTSRDASTALRSFVPCISATASLALSASTLPERMPGG